MKVAMLTYSTKARGGVAHALKLAEHLAEMNVDVTLHSLARDDEEGANAGYFRAVDVPTQIYPYEWHEDVVIRLERMIEAYAENLPRDAEVYHAQDCVGGTALHRMKSAGELAAPVFRTVHHVDDFAEPRLFKFEQDAVARADHLFVVSSFWKDALRRDYGLDSRVVHNGIDLEDFSTLPERRSGNPTVLFVGGLEPRKGLEYLILAMERICGEFPDATLDVVAKTGFTAVDTVDWFKTLACRARIGHAVRFLESIDQGELLQCYSNSDVVVLPSRNEGWGLSLMEAMACGKPVVATRVGGIPELVRDGLEGMLVKDGDLKALSDAIAGLLADADRRTKMGRAGRERVAEFSWKETARLTLEAYSDAV